MPDRRKFPTNVRSASSKPPKIMATPQKSCSASHHAPKGNFTGSGITGNHFNQRYLIDFTFSDQGVEKNLPMPCSGPRLSLELFILQLCSDNAGSVFKPA